MNGQQQHWRILILGGFGRVGLATAQYLLTLPNTYLTLASRHPDKIPATLGARHSDQITSMTLDATDQQALTDACNQHDLLISCIGPSGIMGNRVAKICKETATPLVDAGGYDPVIHSLELAEIDAPTKVPIIINVGLLPGLSGIYPDHLIRTIAADKDIERLDIHYVGRDAWSYNSAWDIINSLGDFGKERGFCYLEHKQLNRISFHKASRKVTFPSPIGTVSTMLIYAEEIMRLAKQHDIANVRVYGANIGPRATMVCALAKVLGFYRSIKGVERGARWLVKASKKDMRKLQPAYGIQVNIHDTSGQVVSGRLTLSDTYQATGVVIGITARTVLEGKHNGPGIFMLHEAINHAAFMDHFAQSDLINFQDIQTQPVTEEAST